MEWFKSWRNFIDNRNGDNQPASQDSMGSDSWHGVEEDSTASSLFLHGNSGVGKSSIVYACAREYGFTGITVFYFEKLIYRRSCFPAFDSNIPLGQR